MSAMLKFFAFCAGSVAMLVFAGNWYFGLPIVHLNPDGKCVRVMVPDTKGEVKVACDAINLKRETYLTEYVEK